MKSLSKIIIFILLLSSMPTVYCDAVEPNLTLAWRITEATKKFRKALENERDAQEFVAEGHVFVGREVQAVNALQREFNEYLDNFHNSVAMAADLYGIYLEIKKTRKLAGQVTSILASAPTNAIAVLLTPSNSGLYGAIIDTSLGAAQDIYEACLSKQKRTEQDRNKLLDIARKKIKKVNSDLSKLIIVLRYTTFEDIWHSIRERAKFMDRQRKHAIIERCYDDWKHNRSRIVIN